VRESDDEIVEHTNVRNAINRYFQQHPQAADTVDGIAKWWLPRFGINLPLESVLRALERMADAGELSKSEKRDGSVIYALAQRKH
jgi:Fe2+ or Zn2+ uptake regulation protein